MSESNFCSKCGNKLNPNEKFCAQCGASVLPDSAQPAATQSKVQGEVRKSRLAAGLLGIFLGGLGIHRFYLGYTTIGIIQIVVTVVTLGIGALWGFVEGIMILAGGINKDAQGMPLSQ